MKLHRSRLIPLIVTCLLVTCILMICVGAGTAHAEDTFSIVAVDPATGEVGSAGASCIGGSIIISDVHPGVGAIHTQSFWNSQNQSYARQLMNTGHSPEAIIDSLVANDAQGNPSIRQYGIADLVGGGRSAGFTGVNCFDYKNHNLGTTYSIAGNILLGQEILDDMENGFLGTAGILADQLMAALQGANVPGADIRCLDDGKPAISAFIRVARPDDQPGGFFLDLNVNNTSPSQNPIDLLQALYDDWRATVAVSASNGSAPTAPRLFAARPNPVTPGTTIAYELPRAARVRLSIHDILGRHVDTVVQKHQTAGLHQVQWSAGAELASGVYFYRLEAESFSETRPLVVVR